jgi:hypothetical protein
MAGESRANVFGGARESLLEGLADALAGMHKQEAALRERLGQVGAAKEPEAKNGEAKADGNGAPRIAFDDGGAALSDLFYDMVRLELRVLDQLTTLSLQNADRLVAFLRQQGDSLRRGATPSVRLAAPAGERATARFVIDNPSPRAADLAVRVSDFDAGGQVAPFRAEVELTPARARLAAGGSIEVAVALTLDARFAPQTRYQAEIEITSPARARRVLPLVVEVGAAAAKAKAKDKAPARKAPKKRGKSKA